MDFKGNFYSGRLVCRNRRDNVGGSFVFLNLGILWIRIRIIDIGCIISHHVLFPRLVRLIGRLIKDLIRATRVLIG